MTTAELNILIRVRAAEAQAEIARLRTQMAMMEQQIERTRTASNGGFFNDLSKSGSRMQWIGRQLMTNLTLPLGLAAGAAVKWGMENEKALARVEKLYGDAGMSAAVFENELAALDKVASKLSETFGVNKKVVLDIAGDWAAAGSSGAALAKSMGLTLRTMVVGEMEAAEATKALIAIQAQYGTSIDGTARGVDGLTDKTGGLTKIINQLNAVENVTATKLSDLVVAYSRAAGVARTAGVSTGELAAMVAALTPAAGTASEAGTALKTMISRLLSPTEEAADVMNEMGLAIDQSTWNSLSATERLKVLSSEFNNLTQGSKSVASSIIASRYHINKFDVLMREISNPVGYFAKAMQVVNDEVLIQNIAQRELSTVLETSGKKAEIAGQIIKNNLTDAFKDLIPVFVWLTQTLAKVFQAFANINPAVQKIIIVTTLFLAALGPTIIMLGLMKLAIGQLAPAFAAMGRMILLPLAPLKLLTAAITAPFVAASFAATRLVAFTSALFVSRAALGGWTAAAYIARAAIVVFTGGLFVIMRTFPLAMAAASAGWTAMTAGAALAWRAIQFISANGAMGTLMIQQAMHRTGLVITGVGLAAQRAMYSAFWLAQQIMTLNHQATITAIQQAWWRAQYVLESAWWGIRLAAEQAFQTARALLANRGYQLQMIIGLTWHALVLAAERFFHTSRIGMTLAYWAWVVTTTRTYQAVVTGLTAAYYAAVTAIQVMWQRIQTLNAVMHAMGLNVIERTFNAARLVAETVFQTTRMAIVTAYNRLIIGAYYAWIGAMLVLQRVFSAAWLTNVAALMAKTLVLFRTGLTALLFNVKRILVAVAAAFLSPWGIAIAAVIALIVAFKDQIWAAIQGVISYFQNMPSGIASALAPIGGVLSAIGGFFSRIFGGIRDMVTRAFNALPDAIKNALMKVVATVRAAAMAVYKWMKYMNPFQRHSPSLVESVTAGMEIVGDKFGDAAARIKSHVLDMYDSMAKFNSAMLNTPLQTEKQAQRQDKRDAISAVAPEALSSYDDLSEKVETLRGDLDDASDAIERQEQVLKDLQTEIDNADKAIESMRDTLDAMKESADRISDALDAAKERFEYYKDAQIAGTRETEDAIFANEMAQKRLQLQIARMGDTSDIDSAAEAYRKMQGEIEMLSGIHSGLRAKGAGSEILGPYEAMIDSLEGQQKAVEDGTGSAVAQIERLNRELEELQRQAEIMDLEKSLKFDPLNRQIDQFVNKTHELPFQDIMSGLRSSSGQVDVYTMALESANMAIAGQEAAIEAAQAARDGLAEKYDLENEKLQQMKEVYDSIEESIREGEKALEDMVSTAEQAIQRAEEAARKAKEKNGSEEDVSPGLQNFRNASTGDFEETGDQFSVGREGGMGDQSVDMIAYADQLAAELGTGLGDFDMFAPIKDAWNKVWGWIKGTFGPMVEPLKTMFGDLGNTLAAPFKAGEDGVSRMGQVMEKLGGWFNAVWDPIQTVGSALWNLFGPDVVETLQSVWAGLQDAWDALWPALKGLFAELGPLIQQLLPYIGWIVAAFLGVIEIVWEMLNGAIRPVFRMIGEVIAGIINVIKGLVEIITGVLQTVKGVIQVVFGFFQTIFGLIKGLFTGDWSTMLGGLGTMGDGVKNILGGIVDVFKGVWHTIGGIWDTIVAIFKGAITTIVGVVGGFIQGIWDFFYWLWDELVGNSIVPDMINGIIQWFLELPGKILGMIGDFIAFIWNAFWSLPGKIFEGLQVLGQVLWDLFSAAWNWLVESFPGWIEAVLKFFWELPGNMISALGDLAGFVGGWIIDQFKKSIEGWGIILGWVWDFFKQVPGKILEGIGNIAQLGIDLVTGFWNGIKEKGQWLKDKIIEWVKEHIPGPIKDVLVIGSPSRLMKEYGGYTAEGFALGMDSGAAQVESSAIALAQTAADAVAAADTPALQLDARVGSISDEAGAGVSAAAADAAMAAVEQRTAAFTATIQAQYTALHDGVLATVTDMYAQITVSTDATYVGITTSTKTFLDGQLAQFTTGHSAILSNAATFQKTMTDSMAAMIAALLQHFTTYKDQLILLATSAQEGVTGQFNTLATNLSNIFTDGIKPVFDSFKPMLDQVVDWFGETVGSIGTVWGGIREPVAVPARFVINDVYNDGIRGAWNSFNSFLDLAPLPEHIAKFATGGSVFGPGTGTSDSIPALLSRGEHVVTAREVQGAGGHAAIEQVRKMWASGNAPAFARGGPVDLNAAPWPGGGGEANLQPAAILARRNIKKYWPEIQTIGGYRASDPYPDHPSGLALDIMTGDPLGTEINDWLHREKDALALNYTIWKQWYKPAGGIGNLMEDRGSVTQNHFDHIHALFNANGVAGIQAGGVGSAPLHEVVRDEINRRMDAVRDRAPQIEGGIGQWIPKSIEKGRNMLLDFLVPRAEQMYKSIAGNGAIGNAESWRPMAMEAMKRNGFAWQNKEQVDAMLRQIMSESSGDPRAIQKVIDVNSGGNEAAGLLQIIPSTWATYRDPALPDDRLDPWANMNGALRYYKAKYGMDLTTMWGRGHGYDKGGLLPPTPDGFGTYYNHTGKPEIVLTDDDWNAIYKAANNPVDVKMIEEGNTKAILKTADASQDAVQSAIEDGSIEAATTWTPAIYDASKNIDGAAHAMEVSADASTGAMDEFVRVGGEIKKYTDAVSKLMLAVVAAAQSEEQTFDTWVPVINAAADLIGMLPDAEPTYMPWAGYDAVYTPEMRQREALNDIANVGKGAYQLFKDVAPTLLRHTATIGSAIAALIAQNAPIVTAAIAMFQVNPVGAAIMLIPVILQSIFTLVPLIINAIMDIVPTLFSAIKKFIQSFLPGAVPGYDDLAAAQDAVVKNEGAIKDNIANPDKWANESQTGTVRNTGSGDTTNINIYGDVTMPNVTNNDGASVFVDNLTNMAKG